MNVLKGEYKIRGKINLKRKRKKIVDVRVKYVREKYF